jgi:hypothetical protein
MGEGSPDVAGEGAAADDSVWLCGLVGNAGAGWRVGRPLVGSIGGGARPAR